MIGVLSLQAQCLLIHETSAEAVTLKHFNPFCVNFDIHVISNDTFLIREPSFNPPMWMQVARVNPDYNVGWGHSH